MADSSFRLLRRRRSPSSEASEAAALPFWHYLVAAVLGAANTFSFAPTPHGGWLELVVFALFFAWLSRTSGWKSAALTGWAFGFGNFVTGVWWLYVSMHFYGGMAAPLAAAAVALFSLYLAIYPAAAAVVWSLVAGRARYDDTERAALRSDLARRVRVRERVGARRMAARTRLHRLPVAVERLCASRRTARRIWRHRGRVRRRLGARARGRARRADVLQRATP
jgi:hypothetical protein